MLLVLVVFLSYMYLPRMFSKDHPLAWPGLIGSVLLACALLSFNESWVIDFERRRVKLYRSLLRFAWCHRSHALEDLTQLGVVGSRHSSENGGDYWQYGLMLASRQGALYLFRDLDTSYQKVLELATHLSQQMGVPLVDPRPFGRMTYSAEQHELRYTSGQAIPKDQDERDKADIHGGLVPILGSRKPHQPPEVEVRRQSGRIEFEQKTSKRAQQGCATAGFWIVGPVGLMGAGLISAPTIGGKLFGLLLLLPALAAACYLLDWMLSPILRQYEYVDGDTRQVGVVQDRGKGRLRVSPFDVPPDARVVCVEVVGSTDLRHGISLRQEDKVLYIFQGGHDARSNRQKAQTIAETLGLPLEMRSDLDAPSTPAG